MIAVDSNILLRYAIRDDFEQLSLARALSVGSACGHQVIDLDALTYATCLDNVARVANDPAYAFENADIRDRATLAES